MSTVNLESANFLNLIHCLMQQAAIVIHACVARFQEADAPLRAEVLRAGVIPAGNTDMAKQ
jgi:hypothetical protein